MEGLRKTYRTAVIIGLAMMASLLVYTVIVNVFDQGAVQRPPSDAAAGTTLEVVKFILLGASAAVFFLVRFISARFLYPGEGPTVRSVQRPPAGTAEAFPAGRLLTGAVVVYAFCEVPAVFGLLFFFLGGDPSDFYLFLIISLMCFASYFPRYSQWEEWYRQRIGRAPRG